MECGKDQGQNKKGKAFGKSFGTSVKSDHNDQNVTHNSSFLWFDAQQIFTAWNFKRFSFFFSQSFFQFSWLRLQQLIYLILKNHKRKTKHCVNIGLIYFIFLFLSFISILYLPGLNSKHSCYWSNFQSLFWKLCHINVAKESPQWKTGKTVYKTTQWKPKWKSGEQERQKSRIPAPPQRYFVFFYFFCWWIHGFHLAPAYGLLQIGWVSITQPVSGAVTEQWESSHYWALPSAVGVLTNWLRVNSPEAKPAAFQWKQARHVSVSFLAEDFPKN